MSLHAKIVAWFVFFAALTVMTFGLADYFQSTHALRFALEARASSLAHQLAAELERRHELIATELKGIGYAAAVGTPAADLPAMDGFSELRVVRDGVVLVEAARDADSGTPACGTDGVDFSVQAGTGANAAAVQASMPAHVFFGELGAATARLGKNGITAVLRSTDGAVVHDAGCALRAATDPAAVHDALAGEVAALGRTGARSAVVEFDALPGAGDAHDRVLVIVRTSKPAWSAVVAVDYDEFAAPFMAARTKYVVIMLAVMALALVVVLRGLRHDLGRLSRISRAAEAIGHGRFDVWLPPPTNDEIGRLTLSLGRMMDRLASGLRQIEVTRSMAAVGELSTYLSHEIRNPLSSIRLNLQMLRRDLATGSVPEDGQQLVGLCLTELQRLDDVVKTVLEVGRNGGVKAAGTCDAHAVIAETVRVMQRKLDAKGVVLSVDLEARACQVAMDEAAFRGALLNLMLNSVDAMNGQAIRRIGIATGLTAGPDGTAGHFAVSVRDNGPGVPPHLRERIFDPFFTTKPTGNGIGLATALRAAQECGGTLRYAQASEDGGADFVLELPLAGIGGGRGARPDAVGPAAAPLVAAS
jgi:signal transduction histidine kinase